MYFNRSEIVTTDLTISLGSHDSDYTMSTSPRKLSSSSEPSFFSKIRQAYHLLWDDFIRAFTNNHVVKWSLWWAFATCGYLQVISYIQLLWQNAFEFQNNRYDDIYIFNGAVEATYTIISKNFFFTYFHVNDII